MPFDLPKPAIRMRTDFKMQHGDPQIDPLKAARIGHLRKYGVIAV